MSGNRLLPARSCHGRTADARTSPSGTARGTDRSARSSTAGTRTVPPRRPRRSRTRIRCRSPPSEASPRNVARRVHAPSSEAPRSSSPAGARAVPRTRASSRPRRGDRSTSRSERCVLKNRIVPRYFWIATSLRSSCWSRVGAGFATLALRGVGAEWACIAAAAACVTRMNASRPTSRALKRLPPERGQGRGPHRRRSCLSVGPRYTTRYEQEPECLQRAKKACHERNRP